MSNHTPGPWVVGRKLTPNGVYTVDGELIANTHSAMRSLLRDEQIAEQDANVRLIAAAPELLAALRAMLSVCGCGTALDCSVCNSARAAILQAEGKS